MSFCDFLSSTFNGIFGWFCETSNQDSSIPEAISESELESISEVILESQLVSAPHLTLNAHIDNDFNTDNSFNSVFMREDVFSLETSPDLSKKPSAHLNQKNLTLKEELYPLVAPLKDINHSSTHMKKNQPIDKNLSKKPCKGCISKKK